MRLRYVGLVMAVCALAVAGCGSSDNSSSSTGAAPASTGSTTTANQPVDVSTAEGMLTKQEQPTKWQAPGPSFKVDPAVTKGKSLCIVAAQLNFDFTKQLVAGATDGAKLAGMSVKAFDSKGSPADAIRIANQCLSQGADALSIISYPTVVVKSAVAAATKKGVPVIMVGEQDSGLPTAEQKQIGVFGHASPCAGCAGTEMADAAAALSSGKVFKSTYIAVPSSHASIDELNAFRTELKKLCATCAISVKNVDFAQWGTQLKPAASAAIADQAQILVPAFDAMVSLMLPAVSQSGAQDKVKFNSYNATKPILEELSKTDLIQADVGASNAWVGWNLADQTLRALNKQPPAPHPNPPDRTFTKKNIGEVDLSADPAEWTGPVVFPDEFKKLWQLG